MLIPKKFQLNGKTYTVRRPKRMRKHATVGRCEYATRTLHVASHSNVSYRQFNDEFVSETFWHEALHAMLNEMKHPLTRDERFVTDLSRLLNELVLSAEL